MKQDLAIVPGSFDPMTLGHYDLIRTVSGLHLNVVVAVMQNREKETMFTLEERTVIAKMTVSDLQNVSVISDEGMLVELFDRIGASVVCKGYRNESDYQYEKTQDEWNCRHNPRFRTELLPANRDYAEISSTVVRNRILQGKSLSGFVKNEVIQYLKNIK